MKVLDLFSGIGGFSLAAHWVGWETVAFCEQDKFCQKVLAKNFPGVPIFDDIKTLKGDQFNGTIDIVCGGFPCQPWSTAGKRRGKEDDRHLWPEMLRIIREVRPRWIVGENVAGIIRMGLDDVLADLESEGYTCQSFVIPACGIGAQHRRDRVWIVAHLNGLRELQPERLVQNIRRRSNFGFKKKFPNFKKSIISFASRILRGVYGLSPWVDRGLKIKSRSIRIKALANSIVPQVVYQIFKAIQEVNYAPTVSA